MMIKRKRDVSLIKEGKTVQYLLYAYSLNISHCNKKVLRYLWSTGRTHIQFARYLRV